MPESWHDSRRTARPQASPGRAAVDANTIGRAAAKLPSLVEERLALLSRASTMRRFCREGVKLRCRVDPG